MEVIVNVFDLLPANSTFRFIRFGGYHTTVTLSDEFEVFFVGSNEPEIGIMIQKPSKEDPGPECTYYASYPLGPSLFNHHQVESILQKFQNSPHWYANTYNILFHNCNSFSYELARELVGPKAIKQYPTFVSRGEKMFRFIFTTSIYPTICLTNSKNPLITNPKPPENQNLSTSPTNTL